MSQCRVPACSKHAQTPLNTDLEMTFTDDCKPNFEQHPPSNSVQLQKPAMQEGSNSRHASGMKALHAHACVLLV